MSRQKLGQHFLASPKALDRIAAAACGQPENPSQPCDLVVEIGPGQGALTERLLEKSRRVVAIELDPVLAEQLRIRWRWEPRLEVVEGDALDVDWTAWGEASLVGNLPYYVSTAIISKFLRNPGPLKQAVFLIQREVADRVTAMPGTRDFGYFSVECQLLAATQKLFHVPPGAFRPPPKVDSSVVRLTPHLPQGGLDLPEFLNFASVCFRQKRKTLRNNLSGLFPPETLALAADAMAQRAEQLSVDRFLALFAALRSRTPESAAPATQPEAART